MRRTVLYIAQALAEARRAGLRSAFAAARDYQRWLRTQQKGSPLEDGYPWITFGAERHLRRILPSVSRAFEFGSGGSTLYLSERVRELVSVEHDPAWSAQVDARLGTRAGVVRELYPPAHRDDPAYRSTDDRYVRMSFRDYACAIDRFPDGHFDLILIDGRARVACFRHALRKLRPRGWLVLDNSERTEYSAIVEAAEGLGWMVEHHSGPGPYVPVFWRTTIWRSTDRPTAKTRKRDSVADEPAQESSTSQWWSTTTLPYPEGGLFPVPK